MPDHITIGKKGEALAESYLKQSGYLLLERNWRSGRLEVDIIARIDKWVVFVEVKSRSTAVFGSPNEAVTNKKQQLLIKAANHYLLALEEEVECRFDVISIIDPEGEAKIEHIENAFYPMV